jgi:hypothetical protein
MKRIVVCYVSFLLLLLEPFVLTAQTPSQGIFPQTPVAWLEHWRLSTFSFGKLSKDSSGRDFFEVIATGFFVLTDDQKLYVVTAKHVFFDSTKDWHPNELRIRFAWQEQKSVYDELGLVITLRDSSGADLWTAAADGSDIAAIAAPPISKLGPNPHAIGVADIATANDMFEGGSVIALGYPGIVGKSIWYEQLVEQE